MGHAARVRGGHRGLVRALRGHFSLVARPCTCEHRNQCEGQDCSGRCCNAPATVCGTGPRATRGMCAEGVLGLAEALPRRHGAWRAGADLGATCG